MDVLQRQVEGLQRQVEGLNRNTEVKASYESLIRRIESAGRLAEFASVEIESINGLGHVDQNSWAYIHALFDSIDTILEAIDDRVKAVERMIDVGEGSFPGHSGIRPIPATRRS